MPNNASTGALRRGVIAGGVALLLGIVAPLASSAQDQPTTGPAAGTAGDLGYRKFVKQIDGLAHPTSVAVDAQDRIYVVENFADRIRVIDREGKELRRFGQTGSAPGQLLAPHGIALTPTGEILITDRGNRRVQVFDPNGGSLRQWGRENPRIKELDQLWDPRGIATDGVRIAVADAAIRRVFLFDMEGKLPDIDSIAGGMKASNQLLSPEDVAFGDDGLLHVADSARHQVITFYRDTEEKATLGDWGYHPGQFATPSGVCVHDGRLYVADTVNHRIQVFGREPIPLYQWGLHVVHPHEGAGRIHYPSKVAIAPSGRFAVVAEPMEDRIQIFELAPPDPNEIDPALFLTPDMGAHFGPRLATAGRLLVIPEPDNYSVLVYDIAGPEPINSTKFGGYGTNMGRFGRLAGVAMEPGTALTYLGDSVYSRLQTFLLRRKEPEQLGFDPFLSRLVRTVQLQEADNTHRGSEGTPSSTPPISADAIATDWRGEVFLLDTAGSGVRVYGRDGSSRRSWGKCGSGDGEFRHPTDIALQPDGDSVYVVDAYNARVQVFSREGTFRRAIGERGTGPGQFQRPFGVAVGHDGSIYVTDTALDRVQRFSADGRLLKMWGERGLGPMQFFKPRGIAVDFNGHVLVLDHGNHRLMKYTPEGEFLSAFGSRLYVMPARRAATSPSTATQPAESGARTTLSNGGSFRIRVRPATQGEEKRSGGASPPTEFPLNAPFDLLVQVLPPNEAAPPLEIQSLHADAAMPHHGHGMNVTPTVERRGPGEFVVRGLLLHMSGRWEMYFDVTWGAVTERAQLDVEIE